MEGLVLVRNVGNMNQLKMSNFIRDTFVPAMVRHVLEADDKPLSEYSEDEFIEFCQALYDQIKIKERELDSAFLKN